MKGWAADLAERAERVPVWTRPQRPSFSGGFAAWGAGAEQPHAGATAEAEPLDLAIEPEAPPFDAFAQGFAEGYQAGEAALDEERAAVRALATALAALRPEPPADLGRLLAATVARMVTQVVGEVSLDEAVIANRAGRIAALIAEESAPQRLRLHPDDAARLAGAALPVELVADASLPAGKLVLETAGGWIEDGPAIRMERLRAALDTLAEIR